MSIAVNVFVPALRDIVVNSALGGPHVKRTTKTFGRWLRIIKGRIEGTDRSNLLMFTKSPR
jgi:hypothetical protein